MMFTHLVKFFLLLSCPFYGQLVRFIGADEEPLYFLSAELAEWETANHDCQDMLGEGGSLANLETEQEFNHVVQQLRQSGDLDMFYWIGGKFDTSSQTWVWTNGKPLGDWLAWLGGGPSLATRMSRVALRVTKEDCGQLKTFLNTDTRKYICET